MEHWAEWIRQLGRVKITHGAAAGVGHNYLTGTWLIFVDIGEGGCKKDS